MVHTNHLPEAPSGLASLMLTVPGVAFLAARAHIPKGTDLAAGFGQ